MLEYSPRYAYVNDFTLIERDGTYHLFHIIGARRKFAPCLVDAGDHVGHATSGDLVHWSEQPVVRGVRGARFCIRHEGRYALCSTRDIAWSDDLFAWSAPAPLSFDYEGWAEVYETDAARDLARGIRSAPRDPFIWRDEEHGRYLMFFCTRAVSGPVHTRGCVGLAESADLTRWRLLPPACGPGRHYFPESPHVVDLGGKYHLFYHLSPEIGLRHAVSERLTGPYEDIEPMDLLPGYIGASETLKVGNDWYFFGRTLERTEYGNARRLCQKSLSLPLKLDLGERDRILFKALPFLAGFRDASVFDSARDAFADHWRAARGDWRINRSGGIAANRQEPIPPNSLYGSAHFTPAVALFDRPCRNLDLECSLQIPTFNGNDCQHRAGILLDGITFKLDIFQKALICQDAENDVLAFKLLPDIKNDKYYRFRIFRNDSMTQVYLDEVLLMYLPAYGDGSGEVGFVVDRADLIVKDVAIWSLNTADQRGFTLDDPGGSVMNGTVY